MSVSPLLTRGPYLFHHCPPQPFLNDQLPLNFIKPLNPVLVGDGYCSYSSAGKFAPVAR